LINSLLLLVNNSEDKRIFAQKLKVQKQQMIDLKKEIDEFKKLESEH
jgi:hypothetical protein